MQRRQFLCTVGGLAAVWRHEIALAQAYPTRPVRILVGFVPGGNFDIVARLIGQSLSEQLSQPVVVENRPGASSNLATEAVVRAPADGYTLLLVGPPHAIKRATSGRNGETGAAARRDRARTGRVLPVRRGLERPSNDADVPVSPFLLIARTCLSRGWRSR